MNETIPPLQTKGKPRYTKERLQFRDMTDEELEECRRIAERFKAVKNRSAFARENNAPGKDDRAKGSIIYAHINAIRPISMASALAYAKGFKCALEEISPRLAREAKLSADLLDPGGQQEERPASQKIDQGLDLSDEAIVLGLKFMRLKEHNRLKAKSYIEALQATERHEDELSAAMRSERKNGA